MAARRVSNLGRLAASMAAYKAVGLSMLKPLESHLAGRKAAVDCVDGTGARAILFTRIFLVELLDSLPNENAVTELVLPPTKSTAAIAPAVRLFVRSKVYPWCKSKGSSQELVGRFRTLELSLKRCASMKPDPLFSND